MRRDGWQRWEGCNACAAPEQHDQAEARARPSLARRSAPPRARVKMSRLPGSGTGAGCTVPPAVDDDALITCASFTPLVVVRLAQHAAAT